jgi:hypothetical protein
MTGWRIASRSRGIALVALVLLGMVSMVGFGAHATEFETIELREHPVRISYEPGDERVARKVGEICDDFLGDLAFQLGLAEVAPIQVEVSGSIAGYRRHFGADLPSWGVAFALMHEGRMVVDVARATRAWNSLESVIPHELSHLLLAQRIGRVAMPIWFLEGLAQWQADEWSMVDGWQLMNAVWSNKAPKLWHLQDRYPPGESAAREAYRVSYAAFTYLFDDRIDELPLFLDEIERHSGFEEAFTSFFDEYPASYYVRFHEHLDAKYKSRLLVFQTGPLFSILAAAFFIVALRYYFRKRRRLKAMSDGIDGPGPVG